MRDTRVPFKSGRFTSIHHLSVQDFMRNLRAPHHPHRLTRLTLLNFQGFIVVLFLALRDQLIKSPKRKMADWPLLSHRFQRLLLPSEPPHMAALGHYPQNA